VIETADQALVAVDRMYGRLVRRRDSIRKLDEAYRGKQPLRFLTDRWAEAHAKRYKDFSDNWCQVVANSPSERLRVNGFRAAPTDGGDASKHMSPDEQWLQRQWGLNQMDRQSSQGFLASIIAKRSYALVWGDTDGEPIITWESADQVIVEHDPERPSVIRLVLKSWPDYDAGLEYATLYTPDDVWKFKQPIDRYRRQEDGTTVTDSQIIVVGSYPGNSTTTGSQQGGWQQRQPAEDDVWPLPNPVGEPPFAEFPNRPMLGGEPLSDIDGTMAMQHAINMLWAYLFNAADFASMPARVVLGQEAPKVPVLDDTGVKIGEKPVDLRKLEADRILWLTGQTAKISQWDSAKLDVFTNTIEVAVTHIAAQTRTPQHYLVGKMANLSADALKAAETGLVKKVEEQQLFFGPGVQDIYRLSALVNDRKALADSCRLGHVQWKDAESRSEAQLVDALTKLDAIGFPFEYLAERYGLSPIQIQRVLDMKRREQADQLFGLMSAADATAGAAPAASGAPGAPLVEPGGTPGSGIAVSPVRVRA
jgi:hypothetical protein